MKKNINLLLVLLPLLSFAQSATLPQSVTKTLEGLFPGYEDVEWKYKNNKYKVKFEYLKNKTEVSLSENGEWLKTETSYTGKRIPESITISLNKLYPKGKFNKVKKIEKKEKNIVYKSTIIDGTNKYKVKLDQDGNLTEVEQKKID